MRATFKTMICGCALAAIVVGDTGAAHSQDFFSQLFGGFSRRVERGTIRLPFAPDIQDGYSRRRDDDAPRYGGGGGGGQAYCVRTCDGRYFPISGQGEQSKAASCNSFCPASETRVFYGSAIDNAASENGKRYGDLPNAFKYRTELVAGCTCNSKSTGLAPVKVEDDPTLKRGDIVAGAEGLMVTRATERRGASLDFSPVSEAVRAKYDRFPVSATE